MSKTIKRIISSLLLVTAFAAIEPSRYINLTSEKVYASTFDSDDHALLESLDTDEGSFSFSRKSSTATGKVRSKIDEVKLSAEAEESDYIITIDGSTYTGDGDKTVDLEEGRNVFKVKVEDPSGDKASATYYVYITRGNSSSSSSDDNYDNVYLKNITVDGNSISFSKRTNSYNVEASDSTDKVRIKAEPEDDDDTVEVDGDTVDEDDNYKKWVSLNRGKNVVKVKIEDEDDNTRTYTLNIYRGEKAPSTTLGAGEIDSEQDSIYLGDLNLLDSGGVNIDYKPKVALYEVNVKEDCDNLIVKAEPDDSDDTVSVNENKVEDTNYSARVYLQKGKNLIKVKVNNDYDSNDDDYKQRIYTIIVNRGTTAINNTASNSNSNSTIKANQWVKNEYGQWVYNDQLGKPLVNTWYYDRSYGKWYRLGFDGTMRRGWDFENGKAYYLNDDGSMQIGWRYINNFWYYFNEDGSMRTGWLQSNGKWYYLYPTGSMASNVRIGGYNLGSDGAMI